ncbi:hypothetical protein [Nannocystis pusilla]|uniref:hypothetical protein n=1 Tax=Nannocystis pusilla TaxID=889268 RepID=UPI003BF43D10
MLLPSRRLLLVRPSAAALAFLSAACGAPASVPEPHAASPLPADSPPPPVPGDISSPTPAPMASQDQPVPKDSQKSHVLTDSQASPVPTDSRPSAPADGQARWWCACYSRVGPTPATACRKAEADCKGLERKARGAGSSAIVPRSLTHVCREIVAEHPGDLLGAREQWKPSERPGAWVSFGACLLPGPPDAGAGDGEPTGELPSILGREQLGELKIGLPAAELPRLLGDRGRRGPAQLSEATGSYVQQWSWPDKGLELTLEAADKRGPYALAAIRAFAPCALRTARGIGLGDSYKSVETAYLADRDPEEEQDELSFVAGSVYSGVIFTFDAERGKVSEIFFGAAAE